MADLKREYNLVQEFASSKKIKAKVKREYANFCGSLARKYGLSESSISDVEEMARLRKSSEAAEFAGLRLRMEAFYQRNNIGDFDQSLKDQADYIKHLHERGS